MALLTDAEAEEIRQQLKAGFRGPWLVRAVERLLADRVERVREAGSTAQPESSSAPPPAVERPAHVWIALEAVPYEGQQIIAVKASKESAQRAADARNLKTGEPFCRVVEYVVGP